jgi:hypothetical protein
MVRHYHPGKEVVTDSIKLQQRILNYLRYSMIPQKATSVSLIKIFFNPSLQEDLLLFLLYVS